MATDPASAPRAERRIPNQHAPACAAGGNRAQNTPAGRFPVMLARSHAGQIDIGHDTTASVATRRQRPTGGGTRGAGAPAHTNALAGPRRTSGSASVPVPWATPAPAPLIPAPALPVPTGTGTTWIIDGPDGRHLNSCAGLINFRHDRGRDKRRCVPSSMHAAPA